MSDKPPKLIDVREPAEYDEQHLESATLIPLGQIGGRSAELDPEVPLLVYCRSGSRSKLAARILAVKGFSKVINMSGGILKWPGETA